MSEGIGTETGPPHISGLIIPLASTCGSPRLCNHSPPSQRPSQNSGGPFICAGLPLPLSQVKLFLRGAPHSLRERFWRLKAFPWNMWTQHSLETCLRREFLGPTQAFVRYREARLRLCAHTLSCMVGHVLHGNICVTQRLVPPTAAPRNHLLPPVCCLCTLFCAVSISLHLSLLSLP